MAKRRGAFWWIDRWRRSTAYTDMTLAEQGAYRNLIDELWLRDGVLPNDERILAKVCGSAIDWPSVRPSVMKHFFRTPEGWRHETHDEVSGSSKFHKSQSEKGKKGAAARWRGHQAKGAEDGPAVDPAIHKDGPANGPAIAREDGPGMAFRTPYTVHRTPEQEPTNPPQVPPAGHADADLDDDEADNGNGNGAWREYASALKEHCLSEHQYSPFRNDRRVFREWFASGLTVEEACREIDAQIAAGESIGSWGTGR